MGFLTKLDKGLSNGWTAFKSSFDSRVDPFYARLNEGTHSYNYETERFGVLGLLGLGNPYYTPVENLKYYYLNTFFLSSCIDLYADTASQVKIFEIDGKGNEVPNSEFVKFLEEPNVFQNRTEFIQEMVINTLTTGISVQYGNYFKNGNFRVGGQIFNIDFNNLSMPKVKNPYTFNKKAIQDLTIIERLDDGEERELKLFELAYFYDRIPQKGFGKTRYNAKNFFNPTSRIFPLMSSLHTLISSQDTMAYLSSNPVNSIVSRDHSGSGVVNTATAPLASDQKYDTEMKLNGKGRYGAGRGKIGDIVVTNESLKRLDLTRDNRKMQVIEMQENAKENIRNRFLVPKDYFADSTYENKQFSEARFTLGPVKTITDNWLQELTNKSQRYFKARGTKLVGSYNHLPAVIEAKKAQENKGLLDRAKAVDALADVYQKMKNIDPNLTWDNFLINHQFNDYFKAT